MYPKVKLKKGREKSLLRFHPWVFSGAIQSVEDGVEPGGLVWVESFDGAPLGTGYLNPKSDIRVRLLDFNHGEIDQAFFEGRFREALSLRRELLANHTNAYRLVNSEGDGLPGLVVDYYGGGLVVSVETLGMAKLKQLWLEALTRIVNPKFVYEHSEKDRREAGSGKASVKEVISGVFDGRVEISEGDDRYHVDMASGQKTGFYLDQREGRGWIHRLSKGKEVLNLFCYTGGFTVPALKAGAKRVTSVETSRPALELLEENIRLNELDLNLCDNVEGNASEFLRQVKEESFDVVIADPPPLCRKQADLMKAGRAYKDLNRLALRAVRSGGWVLTYSCSHFFSSSLFTKVIYQAAQEAVCEVRIVQRFSHPADHPVSVYHPEGEYLKGFLLRKGEKKR